jgi:hypothetical protein
MFLALLSKVSWFMLGTQEFKAPGQHGLLSDTLPQKTKQSHSHPTESNQNQLVIDAWVYCQALYSAPIVYVSSLKHYHAALIAIALLYILKSGSVFVLFSLSLSRLVM